MLTPSDLLVLGPYPQRATVDMAIGGLERVLGGATKVYAKDREFARELFLACFEADIDYAFGWAHVCNETRYLTDDNWNDRTNPAGIAITGEPGKLGPIFKTVRQAARFYVALLLIKIHRGDLSKLGSFRAERATAPDVFDGSVAYALDPTFPKQIRVISDLKRKFGPNNRECVWMCDQNGDTAIAAKGNELFPGLPDQIVTVPVDPTPSPTKPVPLKVEKWMVPRGRRNRPGTKMTAGDLWFIVHESGNESIGADAESQAAWIITNALTNNENGPSYHGSVDGGVRGSSGRGVFYQSLPFDEIGLHAADGCNNPATDYGCFRGLAIEGCVNSDGDEARMRRNYAEIIARIAAGDPTFDWGDGSTRGRFSVKRITQHYKVSDPGPNKHDCPQHMRRQAGAWEAFLAECERQFVIWDRVINGEAEPEFPAARVVISKAGRLVLGSMTIEVKASKDRRFHVIHGGRSRTAPDRDAPISRPSPWLRSATQVVVFPWETTVEGERWHGSNAGNWVPGKMLAPVK